jgi:hypothetical protein
VAGSEIFRELESLEGELLDRLLEGPFPGRDEITEQVRSCRVRTLDEDGCLEFSVLSNIKAPVAHRVPVEAEATDEAGNKIHMLLHVVDGKVNELEFITESEAPAKHLPSAKDWEVIVYPIRWD